MLIEPVPAGPTGRRGRARLLVAIAAPAVLLMAVVGVGALAPDDAPSTAVRPDATPSATRAATLPEPTTGPGPADLLAATAVAFPARVLGLPARTVDDVLADRRAGLIGDELVAVRGYLTIRRDGLDCVVDGTGPRAPFCRRDAILRDDPEPALTRASGVVRWTGSRSTPHLHPQVFAGVGLGPLDGGGGDGDGTSSGPDGPVRPTAVIVIGRFDDPRLADPRASARHPDEGFVIERLVWADGSWQDRRLTRVMPWKLDDLDLRTARAIAAEALPGGTVILSQAMVSAETLRLLDPAASAATQATVANETTASLDRLWYVRAMTRAASPVDTLADNGGPRRLGWVVIGNDGTILARQPEG